MNETSKYPTIGFIGTGAITSALVTGFCTRGKEHPYPLVVSPRNAEKAAQLKNAYPNRVEIADSFQDVVDQSDWIVIAVLPEVGEEVCRSINFRPEHKVINLLSDRTLPEVRSWIGETATLVHMVPLTFNAFFNGPIIQTPPDVEAAKIFGVIGEIIEIKEQHHASTLSAISGTVTPYFTLLNTLIDWARSEGVPGELASRYVTAFFRAVSEEAFRSSGEELTRLAEETTPGGLNYMVRDSIASQDGFTMWAEAMNSVRARLTKNLPNP